MHLSLASRTALALPQQSEFPLDDHDQFSMMPQRGIGLQPRWGYQFVITSLPT
jgi:hypothetical protein